MSTRESRQDHEAKGKPDFARLTPEEQKRVSKENMSEETTPINENIAEEAAKKLDEERAKRSLDQIPPEAL